MRYTNGTFAIVIALGHRCTMLLSICPYFFTHCFSLSLKSTVICSEKNSFLGHFLLSNGNSMFPLWRGEDDFTKRALQRRPKSIDNAIFAFSMDLMASFRYLTAKFVLEEVIF